MAVACLVALSAMCWVRKVRATQSIIFPNGKPFARVSNVTENNRRLHALGGKGEKAR